MELSVMERLLILNLDTLPKVGNILTMKIKQQLMADVGFNEQEIKDYELAQEGEQIKWNSSKPGKEVEIGAEAKKLLINALEKSENLNESYVALYDKLKETEGEVA
jgi:hypothetical protein